MSVVSAWILYKYRQSQLAGRAYVLGNQVTHIRFLPAPSRHSFVYPTVSLLVSLNALEKRQLDLLGGWLFGYGGIWGRVTGLRPSGYLHDNFNVNLSIRQKLVNVLEQHGRPGCELDDAWLMTMPSFLGIEGINPLSVYFCYRQGSRPLWLVVLEVHNTFGERNIYILETGNSEEASSGGFDHEWIFPRQFHVSPFNDRSGHYLCQLIAPSHPPSLLEDTSLPSPRPIVKVTLLTAPPHAEKKLVAILRATHSTPLSITSLLSVLARTPLSLLLAFPRIAYQAYILHYHKRLDVYQRPEPFAPDPAVEAHLPSVPNAVQLDASQIGGGIGWQRKGSLEHWCEQRVYAFLRKRCAETGISVTFVSVNPFERRTTISPSKNDRVESACTLTIYYRSPRIFNILFTMPSPIHAILLGVKAEGIFSVSSEELFTKLFTIPSCSLAQCSRTTRMARCIRRNMVPDSLNLPIPTCHALDDPTTLTPVFVLSLIWIIVTLEEKVLKFFGARFVRGDEPWGAWERLKSGESYRPWGTLGSVRRGENEAE